MLNEKIIKSHSLQIINSLLEKNCEVLVDKKINKYFNYKLKLAKEKDWSTEYLDKKISIKSVKKKMSKKLLIIY